jgi:hypothetical protein
MQALTNVDLIEMSKLYKVRNLSGIYFKDDLPEQLINDLFYTVNQLTPVEMEPTGLCFIIT